MKGATKKFLLDNNCRITKKERRKDIQIDTVVEMIGDEVDDPEIREYAKKENYVIVTKDTDIIRENVKQKVQVSLYYKGFAYVITTEPIDLLSEEVRNSGKIPE